MPASISDRNFTPRFTAPLLSHGIAGIAVLLQIDNTGADGAVMLKLTGPDVPPPAVYTVIVGAPVAARA